MRSLNFRDYVLWPIAYKLGLNPATDFNDTQGRALGTYINSWVRRLYTSADFRDWEIIQGFSPTDHFVPRVHAFRFGTTGSPTVNIGKVLSVHLLDPRTTNDPCDIPFEETEAGIFVGTEHGTQVWIRYLPECPLFTAVSWDASTIFRKGDVTYSPTSGECYVSRVSGNKNHDPSKDTQLVHQPLPPQKLQDFVPSNPGFDAVSKSVSSYLVAFGAFDIADPPPNGAVFTTKVLDSTGAEITSQSVTADGAMALTDVLEFLRAALAADGALSAFTITSDPDSLSVTLEDASDFNLSSTYSPTGGIDAANYILAVNQNRAYIPGTSSEAATPQQYTLQLTDADVRPDAVYTLTFTGPDGIDHVSSYTANKNDSASQILAGLIAEMQDNGRDDPLLAAVGATLDVATATATFTSMQELGIDAKRQVAGSIWWEMQPFPFDLIDAVVRGANADTLKEWGQAAAGAAEEQAVPSEIANRLSVPSDQQFTQLNERSHTKSRYVLR